MATQIAIDSKLAKAYANSVTNLIVEKQPKKVSVFNNPNFGEVRIIMDDNGEPLFCLADVCRALELSNTAMVKSRLASKGISNADTLTAGGVQSMIYINEANLYKCIFQSRAAKAEQFQDWVCDEVLPSIRKTGHYSIKPLSPAQQLLANAQILVEIEQRQMEQERRQLEVENKVAMIEDRLRDNGFLSVVAFASIYHIPVGEKTANRLGRMASKWCKQMKIIPEKVKGGRFLVNTYPMQALRDVFKATFPDKSAMFDVPTYWG